MRPLFSLYQFHYESLLLCPNIPQFSLVDLSRLLLSKLTSPIFYCERLLFCDGKTRCSTLASQRAEVNSGIKNNVFQKNKTYLKNN